MTLGMLREFVMGGLFVAADWLVIMVVGHFVGDWLLQTHPMALAKSKNSRVRARHCWIWTVCVMALPILFLHVSRFVAYPGESQGAPTWEQVAAFAWLWLTHYWLDTYKPLMWYRRTVSRDPDALNETTFRNQFATPRGFVVNVTLDQLFHILTIVPVACWLAWRTA